MARKLRLQYQGAFYHVMNRGNQSHAIFRDDADRERFLETLGETCGKTGWRVHAWCLMKNHFHLVIETPKANLVAGMKWLLGVYTMRFNHRHKVSGHLFSGRYKALVVDGGGNGFLKTVCDYAHLNPARAKLVAPDAPLADFRWSSYPQYLLKPAKRPSWLSVEKLLGEHGIPKDSAAGRRRLEARMEQSRLMKDQDRWKPVRRGWCLGDKKFRKELLARMKDKKGGNHYGEAARETDVEQAERIVRQELKARRWHEAEWARRRKGDPEKLKVALRLRQETAMTLRWIAERLKMGAAGSLANRLRPPRNK